MRPSQGGGELVRGAELDHSLDLSIVVPVYNEQECLPRFGPLLVEELERSGLSYEVWFIDDGSTDHSGELLDGLAATYAHLGVIHLRRNAGKSSALAAGFEHARAKMIGTLDADLQDDVAALVRLAKTMPENVDGIVGARTPRSDSLGKRCQSYLFNTLVRLCTGSAFTDLNSGLKVFRAPALIGLHLYGELHRFLPLLVQARGFQVVEEPVAHHSRAFGQSKYGPARAFSAVFDLMTVLLTTRFRARPLHLFGIAGVVLGLLGVVILGHLSGLWFAGYGIGQRPLLFLGLLLVMVGVQLVSMGLVGELVNYHLGERDPGYTIRRRQIPTGAAGQQGNDEGAEA